MEPSCCRASAPGKLIILGEHAVLHGHQAIVAAVDRRLTVTATVRRDHKVLLSSGGHEQTTTLEELAAQQWSRFLVGVLRHLRPHLRSGLDLTVQAEFDSRVGLGSSAAVTVAALAAIGTAAGLPVDRSWLLREGLAVVRAIQGSGSGADLAASVYGGVIAYRAEPLTVEPLAAELPLTVLYTGTKASTTAVIAQVEERRRRLPGVLEPVYQAMQRSTELAAGAIRAADWPLLGELLDTNRGLMASLGVSRAAFESMAEQLRACPGIFGVKLSGAGMGDCLIGLGVTADPIGFGERLPLRVSPTGVEIAP